MEQDQRLSPLPKTTDLSTTRHEYTVGYSGYDDEIVEGRRTIKQYINIIYKRLPMIVALTLIVTAAAAFYMFRQPTQYEATTNMVIEPRRPKVTSKDAININFGNDVNYYNTQLQLLQSPDLKKQVVIELGLYRDATLDQSQGRGLLAGIGSMFSGGREDEASENALPVVSDLNATGDGSTQVVLSPEEEARVARYAGSLFNVSVQQVERTNLVQVRVRSSNQALAPEVSNRLAEVFRRQDAEQFAAAGKRAGPGSKPAGIAQRHMAAGNGIAPAA
jgi:uncharacterized protein involved in exopolysaccharide biosynthesis